VATQSFIDPSYGALGLASIARGAQRDEGALREYFAAVEIAAKVIERIVALEK